MHTIYHRVPRQALLCTLCGQEIDRGETYWYCNGSSVCRRCLSDFAQRELAPYRQIRGEEEYL